jgi:nicotinate-nucleotide adenylyltransferase
MRVPVPEKIGLLGGSFAPVHVGHLVVAEEVRVGLGLSRVCFIPAGQPYMKAERKVTPARHRLEMVRLAIASNPFFQVSSVEVARPGPSYTVDTLELLRGKHGNAVEMYFILGWDSVATLPQWRDVGRLLKMCLLVAVPRPGWERPDVGEMERVIPGVSEHIILLDEPWIGISSTTVRSRVARGGSIRYLVPAEVERYIEEHSLYRDG